MVSSRLAATAVRGGSMGKAVLDPVDELRAVFGPTLDLHGDLRAASREHQASHGERCGVYPSDPTQAALWPFLAALTGGRRWLEIGCGLGHTAALMASAGGPTCRVDTIESNPLHADLALQGLARKRLGRRVRVLRGNALDVLPTLVGPYEVVFLDGDWQELPRYLRHLVLLTRRGSIVVTANLAPLMGGWDGDEPRVCPRRLARDRRFRTYITPGQWHAYSLRL